MMREELSGAARAKYKLLGPAGSHYCYDCTAFREHRLVETRVREDGISVEGVFTECPTCGRLSSPSIADVRTAGLPLSVLTQKRSAVARNVALAILLVIVAIVAIAFLIQ